MPALFRKLRHHYAPLAILAGASVLAACGPKANQAAASDQLHRAGSDLKQLARDTDRSAAALTSAAGDAAADAGGAIAKAARRADIAAQRSAAAARANTAQN